MTNHQVYPNTFDSFSEERRFCRRRRDVGRLVYAVWTADGTDDSGLAIPLFDGRVESLGLYLMDLLLDHVEPLCEIHQMKVPSSQTDHAPTIIEEQIHYSTCIDDKNLNTTTGMGLIDKHPWHTLMGGTWDVDRLDPSQLSYQDFYHQYMSNNEPVLFLRGLTDHWPATLNWITKEHSADGTITNVQPNLHYLSQNFGKDCVTVHSQLSKGFVGSTCVRRETINMTLEEYTVWWREFQNRSHSHSEEHTMYYMKDWKFVAAHKDYEAYTTPHFFVDDWLNGSVNHDTTRGHTSLQAMGDAYKFCYLGPAGSITPLHADVLNSYSWSSNICGSKRWWMIPPRFSYLLYDSFGQKLAPHLHSDLDMGDLGKSLYPGLSLARRYAVTFVQHEGETVFVPSAWYHAVENMEDTLSINHNWINGTNIDWSWEKVRNESEASSNMDDLQLLFLIIQRKAMVTIDCERNEDMNDMKKISEILDSMYRHMTLHCMEAKSKLTSQDVYSLKLLVENFILQK